MRGGSIDETEDMPRFESQSVSYLAIYNGTTPVLKIRLFAQGIQQITDLNNDGKNELLLDDGFTNNGATMISVWLKQIENGERRTTKNSEMFILIIPGQLENVSPMLRLCVTRRQASKNFLILRLRQAIAQTGFGIVAIRSHPSENR